MAVMAREDMIKSSFLGHKPSFEKESKASAQQLHSCGVRMRSTEREKHFNNAASHRLHHQTEEERQRNKLRDHYCHLVVKLEIAAISFTAPPITQQTVSEG